MKTKKITFCAAMAAMSTVLMLAAYFPYITYAVPCMAALPIMAVVIELNKRWAFLTYIVSALPIFLFCETESKILYFCFTGFYPVLKVLLEKLKSRIIEYLLKFLCFNLAIVAVYFVSVFIFGVSFDDLGELGKYGVLAFIIIANCAFIAFDFCLSKMAIYYILRLHKTVGKMLG